LPQRKRPLTLSRDPARVAQERGDNRSKTMSIIDEIKKAVGAHGMWKARLRTAIDSGKSDIDVTKAGRDDQCEFGKWLYGPTLAQSHDCGDYRDVKDLHAKFHAAAAKTLELALSGRKAEAEKMVGSGEFATCSAQLTAAMMRWMSKG
jgi:methyl-accepting chemotaxis protein